MKPPKIAKIDSVLREKAEQKLSVRTPHKELHLEKMDTERLLHELQVHQIELEMQNEALQQSQSENALLLDEFKDLYETAPIGDLSLRVGSDLIVNANEMATHLFACAREVLIGSTLQTFVVENDKSQFFDFLKRVGCEPTVYQCEIRIHNSKKSLRHVLLHANSSVRSSEYRVALIDITQRKDAEHSLENALQKARDLARVKDEFLSNMSHELRTPMSGVIGMIQLTLETKLSPEQREYLITASHSADALLKILNDILDHSKLEAHKVVLSPVDFDVNSLVKGVEAIFLPDATKKRVKFTLSGECEGGVVVRGDDSRIRQILLNLVSNALKFTSPGGSVVLRTSSKINLSQQMVTLHFSVSDTGIGINPGQLSAIFEPFVQADCSTTRRFGGTGLGLSISRKLAQEMGGFIWAESVEQQGSTFHFKVTLAKVAPSLLSLDHHAPLQAVTQSPARKILVVEDNEVNQKLVKVILEKLGHTVTIAQDGREALMLYKQDQFDLILMDCHMPLLNGYETTIEIRKIEATSGGHVPIIAMTADAMKMNEKVCLECGMDAFISKPYKKEDLRTLVDQASAHNARPLPPRI